MRNGFVSGMAVLAGLVGPALAQDAAGDALAGVSFPVTVRPAGNTQIYAEQGFSVLFAPGGQLYVTPPAGIPAPEAALNSYTVEDVEEGGSGSATYRVTLTLNLLYIKDIHDPTGPVPAPLPYSDSTTCHFTVQTGLDQVEYSDCVLAALPDGGPVTVGDY